MRVLSCHHQTKMILFYQTAACLVLTSSWSDKGRALPNKSPDRINGIHWAPMRVFTDAATLSIHVIFAFTDWYTSSGKRTEAGRKKARLRLSKMREWGPRRGKKEVWGIHLAAAWLTASLPVPAQTEPKQITISFAMTWSISGLMALQCHIPPKVYWNICERRWKSLYPH